MYNLLFLLYTLSGFFFLSIETIWIRTIGLYLGNTVVSATLVTSVFFLFAALGNLWISQKLSKFPSALKAYARLEIGCGLTAALLFALKNMNFQLISTPFFYVMLFIALPSFLSGATFPALSQALLQTQMERTSKVGKHYAGNLLGAALGVIFGGLYLPQFLGYSLTYYLSCLGLILIGSLAYLKSSGKIPVVKKKALVEEDFSPRLAYVLLFCSGFFSLLLEILISQYFRQFSRISMQAVAAVFFAFILNLGLGAILTTYLREKYPSKKLIRFFLWVAGTFCFLYPFIFHLFQGSQLFMSVNSLNLRTWLLVGFAALLLLPLLVPVGALFPLSWELVERTNLEHGKVIGKMAFINKIGASLGALIVPFILIPLFGLPGTLIFVGSGYLLLAFFIQKNLLSILVISVLVIGSLLLKPIPLRLASGEELIAIYEGADGVTAVYDDIYLSRHIISNQNYVLNGTQSSLLSQKQESWIPLLLHKDPKKVAFIGMASGISANAALDFPIENLEAIELIPDVVKAAKEHFSEWNSRLFTDPRSKVITEDGRKVVESFMGHYDVVISTLLQPDQDGTASLYSLDFFQNVKNKLNPEGLICIWLPFYQMDDEISGTIIKTFLEVFPYAAMVRGNLEPMETVVGLIGSQSPLSLDLQFLTDRLNSMPLLAKHSPHFKSAPYFKTLLLGNLTQAKKNFSDFKINTDDHPVISFIGPKFIAPGTNLRGLTNLKWLDQRLPVIGDLESEENRAIRAGKYYFVSKVYQVDIPGMSPAERIDRSYKAQEALKTAQEIYPEGVVP